ncbi:branched-chain amino acid ABC transporter permease [Bradyrhizobium sp. SK17]|uniref:branched-chain amino acid ABC transporter permease n=1 Tax=Bradyrhizobium sp. SK17 TaxID=2057741 RepID=UPI001AEC8F93|nr:branched-chain amino acid ABC transporter permease [Bradyrhizobium sp. SK17]
MSVESIDIPADRKDRQADVPVWQVRVGTRLSRVAAMAGVVLVVVLAVLPAVASRNLIQDLIFVLTMLTLAQLWNVLAGWGGLVSVGQQAFVGLGAYALFAGIVMAGLDPVAAIPLAGLFAALIATVLGPLLFRLEGPYFAIGSWVAAEALRLICAQFKSLGGGTGMSISPSELSQMFGLKAVQAVLGLRPAAARDVLVYWLALLLAVLVTLAIYAFMRSRHGLALAASRDNAAAARSVGVRTARIRHVLWIAVAFATGMVGAVVYLQKARISPDAAFSVTDWTAYVIFIVVIGGVRTIEGPMVGVLLLWGLVTWLAQYGSLYLVVLGTLAILIMLFMPRGVWGAAARRWQWQLFPTQRWLGRSG